MKVHADKGAVPAVVLTLIGVVILWIVSGGSSAALFFVGAVIGSMRLEFRE